MYDDLLKRLIELPGNSFEDLTGYQSNITPDVEEETATSNGRLTNGANTLPRAQLQDSNIDPSHSQYVETLRNLAPIWLVNPGGHPKTAVSFTSLL